MSYGDLELSCTPIDLLKLCKLWLKSLASAASSKTPRLICSYLHCQSQ